MNHKTLRIKTVLILLILVPLGFLTKFYSGPASDWVNNHLGGFFYVLFWVLVLFFINPRWNSLYIALIVTLITCGLEFTQLLNSPMLEIIRSNFIGRTLIGSSYTPVDMIYYVIGGFGGWFMLILLKE